MEMDGWVDGWCEQKRLAKSINMGASRPCFSSLNSEQQLEEKQAHSCICGFNYLVQMFHSILVINHTGGLQKHSPLTSSRP